MPASSQGPQRRGEDPAASSGQFNARKKKGRGLFLELQRGVERNSVSEKKILARDKEPYLLLPELSQHQLNSRNREWESPENVFQASGVISHLK